jgi:hypothetical protein
MNVKKKNKLVSEGIFFLVRGVGGGEGEMGKEEGE